jgi:NitT/TauT family transport system substrate-binding protein
MRLRARMAMSLAVAGLVMVGLAAACQPAAPATTAVSLQLQWAPQAQFAGYFAAKEEGYYAAEGLDVTILDGGPDVIPQVVGSDSNGPEFTISWLPKVLEVRDKGQSDLVNIAQVFQRSGTLSVSWADSNITSPADFAGKKVGVWDFGNEYEVTAGAKKFDLEQGTDYTKVIQPFDMTLLLNGADGCAADATNCVDVAEAMIYNEYAQVLEATNPATGNRYQPSDLNVINYNDVGTAMLQDGIFARAAWLAEAGNEDIAVKFLRASFRGWQFCRDNAAKCVEYTLAAGPALPAGHQAWMMNEINPLVWPSPNGIGQMPTDTYQQTVDIALDAGILSTAPGSDAYRTDLATQALEGITGDTKGTNFQKGTVEVTAGGN